MPQACNFIKKETLAQTISCEFCEIFKNTYCYWTPLVATSIIAKRKQNHNKFLAYSHTLSHAMIDTKESIFSPKFFISCRYQLNYILVIFLFHTDSIYFNYNISFTEASKVCCPFIFNISNESPFLWFVWITILSSLFTEFVCLV